MSNEKCFVRVRLKTYRMVDLQKQGLLPLVSGTCCLVEQLAGTLLEQTQTLYDKMETPLYGHFGELAVTGKIMRSYPCGHLCPLQWLSSFDWALIHFRWTGHYSEKKTT